MIKIFCMQGVRRAPYGFLEVCSLVSQVMTGIDLRIVQIDSTWPLSSELHCRGYKVERCHKHARDSCGCALFSGYEYLESILIWRKIRAVFLRHSVPGPIKSLRNLDNHKTTWILSWFSFKLSLDNWLYHNRWNVCRYRQLCVLEVMIAILHNFGTEFWLTNSCTLQPAHRPATDRCNPE